VYLLLSYLPVQGLHYPVKETFLLLRRVVESGITSSSQTAIRHGVERTHFEVCSVLGLFKEGRGQLAGNEKQDKGGGMVSTKVLCNWAKKKRCEPPELSVFACKIYAVEYFYIRTNRNKSFNVLFEGSR
jgi:hypothetical protein